MLFLNPACGGVGASSLLPAAPVGLEKPILAFLLQLPPGPAWQHSTHPFFSYQAPAIAGLQWLNPMRPNAPCPAPPCPAPPHIPTIGWWLAEPFHTSWGSRHGIITRYRGSSCRAGHTHCECLGAPSRQHSPPVLQWFSARASCCMSHLWSHLLQSQEQGRHSSLFPKRHCLDEASAMWGLALAFLMAPLHLPEEPSKGRPWLRSRGSFAAPPRSAGERSVCSQGEKDEP